MKDFPFFSTQYGVASLTLKEVPYRQEAYIRVQEAFPGMCTQLIQECADFCSAVGAEKIYAAGHDALISYPMHTCVYQMRGDACIDPQMVACLFPVTQKTVGSWRTIYNERMRSVDNASTLESRDEEKILKSGGAYFIHSNAELLGIGWLEENTIKAVAAVKPGAGKYVMHTLMSVLEGERITLEVASTNLPAIRLYEQLGFIKTAELSRWYRVK